MRNEARKRLDNEIHSALERPWQYGAHDCGAFAYRCAAAQMGVDFYEPEEHQDWCGLARQLRERGGSLYAWMEQLTGEHGWRRVPVRRARRGAVMLGRHWSGRHYLGINDCGILTAARPSGLIRLPYADAVAAWEVV